MTSGKGPSGGPKRFDGGGQSTSYFAARRKQLNRSESSVEPMGIPMVKEMIQNADDRKAQELFLVFTLLEKQQT